MQFRDREQWVWLHRPQSAGRLQIASSSLSAFADRRGFGLEGSGHRQLWHLDWLAIVRTCLRLKQLYHLLHLDEAYLLRWLSYMLPSILKWVKTVQKGWPWLSSKMDWIPYRQLVHVQWSALYHQKLHWLHIILVYLELQWGSLHFITFVFLASAHALDCGNG